MVERNFGNKQVRCGDGTPMGRSFLEIHLTPDGDIYVTISSLDRSGKSIAAQVEFTAPLGGGQHPRTRDALLKLMQAIEQDNNDPELPSRYVPK